MPESTQTDPDLPTVRLATPGDCTAIAGLTGELGYPASETEMHGRLTRLLSRAEDAVFVAELGAVVGWLHVSLLESLESASFAEIRGLVVGTPYRGRGIGTALIAAAEHWALAQKCSRIRVRSNSIRARAKNFYERYGYTVTKVQNVFDKPLSATKTP